MHTEMEAMNKAIRTLNKTIADPKKLRPISPPSTIFNCIQSHAKE